LLLFSAPLKSEELRPQLRLSVDYLDSKAEGVRGFIGTSLLVPINKNVYFSPTIYSAAFGESGGLYIGGFEISYRNAINADWLYEAGIFIGGGGGASIVNDDGLLIHPKIALLRKINQYKIYSAITHYNLAGTGIDSLALEFGLEMPLGYLDNSGSSSFSSKKRLLPRYRISPYAKYYNLDGSKNRGGTRSLANFRLIGVDFEIAKIASSNLYIQAAGTIGGDAEGYAEWFIGLRKALANTTVVPTIEFGIGTGGGGDVNTGGGLLYTFGAGLEIPLTSNISVSPRLAYVASLNGDFNALSPALHFHLKLDDFDPVIWGSANWMRLEENAKLRYSGMIGEDVDSIGVSLDWYFHPGFYASGKAYTSFDGQAGGFQIGLVGMGINVLEDNNDRVFLEAGIGAAGGAGIDTAGGLLSYGRLGYGRKLTDSFEIYSAIGNISAVKPGMSSTSLELGVSSKF